MTDLAEPSLVIAGVRRGSWALKKVSYRLIVRVTNADPDHVGAWAAWLCSCDGLGILRRRRRKAEHWRRSDGGVNASRNGSGFKFTRNTDLCQDVRSAKGFGDYLSTGVSWLTYLFRFTLTRNFSLGPAKRHFVGKDLEGSGGYPLLHCQDP
jgi:hypothetical protein